MSDRTLVLIDVQRNMLLPPQPVPDAPAVGRRIAEILERARRAGAMVIHVRNNGGEDDPDAPGTMGWELVHEAAGHEAVVDKHTPDAFAGTGLGNLLGNAREVVIAGMQSEYCVRETSLSALERGIAGRHGLSRGPHMREPSRSSCRTSFPPPDRRLSW